MKTRISCACLCFAFVPLAAGGGSPKGTTCISFGPGGVQGEGDSWGPSLSADGRYVAFESTAENLVPDDTNGVADIFLRDRLLKTTTLVSVDSNGVQGNGDSDYPRISADGRYVTYFSRATNLVPGDTNESLDVFVRDLLGGTTTRVSVDSEGVQGNDGSLSPVLSGDGRFVAFESYASNLVAGDTNGANDTFVHDRVSGTTLRVSVTWTGAQVNATSGGYADLSKDGRYVAFASSGNLTPGANGPGLYVRDLESGTLELVSVNSAGVQAQLGAFEPRLSADGRIVTFSSPASNLAPGDTNGIYDVFVRDLEAGITTRISVSSNGAQGNLMSWRSAISGDGRFVVFKSSANNLVPDDTNGFMDVFLHDRLTGTTIRASESSSGVQPNAYSSQATISDDGRHVGLYSPASNLTGGDNNWSWDVFVVSFGKLARR